MNKEILAVVEAVSNEKSLPREKFLKRWKVRLQQPQRKNTNRKLMFVFVLIVKVVTLIPSVVGLSLKK